MPRETKRAQHHLPGPEKQHQCSDGERAWERGPETYKYPSIRRDGYAYRCGAAVAHGEGNGKLKRKGGPFYGED